MADVFVSYAREDRERVAGLVAPLEGRAWSVFWDRGIPPGESWRSYIGTELEKTRCVVVAWSERSAASDWVVEEADERAVATSWCPCCWTRFCHRAVSAAPMPPT